jgi:hypothetical protein
MGAVVAEVLAEDILVNQNNDLDKIRAANPKASQEELLQIYEEHVSEKIKLIKIETAAIGLLSGADVQAAYDAGVNAIENNSLRLIMALANLLLTAQEVADTIDKTVVKLEDADDKTAGNPEGAEVNVTGQEVVFDIIQEQAGEMAIGLGLGAVGKVVKKTVKTLKSIGKNKELAKKIVEQKKLEKIHVLYEKKHPTKPSYIGRTSGKGDVKDKEAVKSLVKRRDANHHKNAEGFKPAEPIVASKNPDAIRGLEQIKITEQGGAFKKGGTSSNAINSISDKNPKMQKYLDAANKLQKGGE